MFEALLLVCALATPENCVRFDDTRGPYETYEQCKTRSYEMAEGVAQMLFFESDEVCEVSYKDRGGKYQGQTGVTLPKT